MKIQVKKSSVPGKVPTNGTLEAGELAVNLVDGKMFTGDATKQTVELGGSSVSSLDNTTDKEVRISEMVSMEAVDFAVITPQADKLYFVLNHTDGNLLFLGADQIKLTV